MIRIFKILKKYNGISKILWDLKIIMRSQKYYGIYFTFITSLPDELKWTKLDKNLKALWGKEIVLKCFFGER